MSEHCDKHLVWIARIDRQRWKLLAIAQTKVLPRFARVRRFIDSVADGKVWPMQSFSTGYIDNIRVRGGNGNGANRLRGLAIEDGVPGSPLVVTLPNSTIALADVKDIWLARNPRRGACAASAKRPDHTPVHLRKWRSLLFLSLQLRRANGDADEQSKTKRTK